jgi:hypothetical protein
MRFLALRAMRVGLPDASASRSSQVAAMKPQGLLLGGLPHVALLAAMHGDLPGGERKR